MKGGFFFVLRVNTPDFYRYTLHPETFAMHVYARRAIMEGEELSVQYLSALYGTSKRRKRIKSEWYFDCSCQR